MSRTWTAASRPGQAELHSTAPLTSTAAPAGARLWTAAPPASGRLTWCCRKPRCCRPSTSSDDRTRLALKLLSSSCGRHEAGQRAEPQQRQRAVVPEIRRVHPPPAAAHPLADLGLAEVLAVTRLDLQVERVEVLHDGAVYHAEPTLPHERHVLPVPATKSNTG